MISNFLAFLGRNLKRINKEKPGLIVLAYHSISDEGISSVDVPPATFKEQILWLKENYEIITINEAIQNSKITDKDRIVLTFDDGYMDFYTNAAPFLQDHGIPAVVYVVTSSVVDPNSRFTFRAGAGKKSLNETAIKELSASNLFTIGSHTHTHINLDLCQDLDKITSELETSRKIVKDLTGQDEVHFCYPWSEYNNISDSAVQQRFCSAVIGKGSKNIGELDRYHITRIPIKNERLKLFKSRVRGELFLETYLRSAKTRIRRLF